MPWLDDCTVVALVNAGPFLFKDVELSSLSACRLVCTSLSAERREDRGVKNLLNERGVTGGGLLGFRRAPDSDTMDGGEDGISWEETICTGSDCR